MNKLNLILRSISCAGLLLTGGSAIYNANQLSPETTIEQTVTETTDSSNAEVTDNRHGTGIKTVDSHYQEPEEASSTPTAPDTPSTAQETPVQTIAPSAPQTYRFSDVHAFEQAYVGKCPQDVPEGEFHLPLEKHVALGYIDSYANYSDINTAAIYAWKLLEGGFGGQPLVIFIQRLRNIDNWANLTPFVLVVNTSNWLVSWEYRGNRGYSQDLVPQLDSLAAQLQATISSLESQYHAKCGY